MYERQLCVGKRVGITSSSFDFFALPGVTFSFREIDTSTPLPHTPFRWRLSKPVAEPSKRINRMVELNRKSGMPEAEITKVWLN